MHLVVSDFLLSSILCVLFAEVFLFVSFFFRSVRTLEVSRFLAKRFSS